MKIFDNHVYGTKNYVPTLKNQLQHIGLRLKDKKNPSLSAQFFGFLGLFQDKKIIIKKVEPNSEADKKHIAPEDQITKINGKEINKPLNEILKGCEKEVYVTIKKKFTEKEIKLTIGNYFSLKEIDSVKLKNTKQIRNFNFWIS